MADSYRERRGPARVRAAAELLLQASKALEGLEKAASEPGSPAAVLLPELERMAEEVSTLAEQMTEPCGSPCAGCANRASCEGVCDRLEALLPGAYRGRGRREGLGGLHANMPADQRPDSRDLRRVLTANWHLFTPRQREVLVLYHCKGLTHKEIARQLGVSRSAVSERLARAKARWQSDITRHRMESTDQA